MVTENIKVTKHTVLSDGDNNISANKMAVIPAHCIDKEDGEVWMLFVGTPSCNYPMTEPFWAMIDETFWGGKHFNKQISLDSMMTSLAQWLAKQKTFSEPEKHGLI